MTTRAKACEETRFISKSGCNISFSNWSFRARCEMAGCSSSPFFLARLVRHQIDSDSGKEPRGVAALALAFLEGKARS
jgi:hypothetical protein